MRFAKTTWVMIGSGYEHDPARRTRSVLEKMDWAAYDQQSQRDLQEATAAYRMGDRGMPAREFFDSLYREDELTTGNA